MFRPLIKNNFLSKAENKSWLNRQQDTFVTKYIIYEPQQNAFLKLIHFFAIFEYVQDSRQIFAKPNFVCTYTLPAVSLAPLSCHTVFLIC
jgi:hypothetical protein